MEIMRVRAPNERKGSKLEGQRAATAAERLERKRVSEKKKSRTTSGRCPAEKQEE